VLPFPHKKDTGVTPPVDVAVQVIFVEDTLPAQDAASVEALAIPTELIIKPPAAKATKSRDFIEL